MTVAELIAVLKRMPQGSDVYVDLGFDETMIAHAEEDDYCGGDNARVILFLGV